MPELGRRDGPPTPARARGGAAPADARALSLPAFPSGSQHCPGCMRGGLWLLSVLYTFTMAAGGTTTLYLRHGAQLSTEPPSMDVINDDEMAAAMSLHATTQYFHSDFAHTDYIADDPANRTTASTPGGTHWESKPLSSPCTLRASRIKTLLWIGTNAVESEFTASLSHGTGDGEWSSVCGATGNTLYREGQDQQLPLPGKSMVAASANGGFSVALPLDMELAQEVEIPAGNVLRLDVTCGAQSAAAARERVDQRIWHNAKWASTVEVDIGAALTLPFEAHPVITQPGASML